MFIGTVADVEPKWLVCRCCWHEAGGKMLGCEALSDDVISLSCKKNQSAPTQLSCN